MENLFENVGKTRGLAITIIEMFEDILDKHGIKVPDEHRSGEESEAALYGATYYELEDKIWELLCEYIDE